MGEYASFLVETTVLAEISWDLWAPSPAGLDHLLGICQMTQPFGTHFSFSRILPTMFLGRGKETSLGDVFIPEHLFSLGVWVGCLVGKRELLVESWSLVHSSHSTYPNKPFLAKQRFLIFFSFSSFFLPFPFPFSPSFLKCFFQEQSSRPGLLLTVGGDGVEWLDVGGVVLAGTHC